MLLEERGKVLTEKNQNLVEAADYSTNVIDEMQMKINFLYQKSLDDFKKNEQIMDALDNTVSTVICDIRESKESHQQCFLQLNTVENEVLQLRDDISNENQKYAENLDKLSLKRQKSKLKDTVNKQFSVCTEEKDFVVDKVEKLNKSVKACTETKFNELLSKSIPNFMEKLTKQTNSKKEMHSKISLGINDVREIQMNHLQQRIKDLKSYQTETSITLESFKEGFEDSIQDTADELQILHAMKRKIEKLENERENEIKELTKLVDSISSVKESINDGVEEQMKLCAECYNKLSEIPDQLEKIASYQQHVSLLILLVCYI